MRKGPGPALLALGILLFVPPPAQPFGANTVSLSPGTNLNSIISLTISGSFAYWEDWNTATIYRAPLGGGPVQTVYSATIPPGDIGVLMMSFAVDGGWAFWTQVDFNQSGIIDKAYVLATPAEGGAVKLLANITVAWGWSEPQVEGLTTLEGTVYFIADGGIYGVPEQGGAVTNLVRGIPGSPGDLTAAGDNVYWYDAMTGGVWTISPSGGGYTFLGGPTTPSSNGEGRAAIFGCNCRHMVVAGGYIYWTDLFQSSTRNPEQSEQNETLYRVSTDGNYFTTLYTNSTKGTVYLGEITYDPYSNTVLYSSATGIWAVGAGGGGPRLLRSGWATSVHLSGQAIIYSTGYAVYETSALFLCANCAVN